MRVVLVLVLAVAGCSPPPVRPVPRPPPASPISDRMDTFEMNGYTLADAQYWAYVGKDDVRDQDVLWGFYPAKGEIPRGHTAPNPDSATAAAIACAQEAFASLQVYLAKAPPELRGGPALFYLRTNDYSRAADPFPRGVREPRLSRTQDHWLWEATLTQSGECELPHPDQHDQEPESHP